MRDERWPRVVRAVCGLMFVLGTCRPADAEDVKHAYPSRAPVEDYRVDSVSHEIALSRSAAPSSISGDATVLTLGDRGYETTSKGKNGFVCLVQRSWASGFNDAEFWNAKLRAPICFNAAAARTILAAYLERTQWVVAGVSRAEMISRTKAEVAEKHFAVPESGALAYMMSKDGYLGDLAGQWHPHVMFFVARTDGVNWGADLKGSPVFSAQDDSQPITTFFVLLPRWSDGTSAVAEAH